MNKIPSKYQSLIKILRDSLVEAGGEPLGRPQDFGLNDYYPSESGGIEIVMDYGTVHRVSVPEGTITPYGSHVCGDRDILLKLLQERLGLVMITPQRDDTKIDEFEFQTRPSGPLFEATAPIALSAAEKRLNRLKARWRHYVRRAKSHAESLRDATPLGRHSHA